MRLSDFRAFSLARLFWPLALLSFTMPGVAQEKAARTGYYLTIIGKAPPWEVRINDMPVWHNDAGDDDSVTLSIDHYLNDGTNEISVIIAEIEPPKPGERSPPDMHNPDFNIFAELDRVDLTTREHKQITLVNLAMSKKNEIAFPETNRFGQAVVASQTPPKVLEGPAVDAVKVDWGWKPPFEAQRVRTEFEVAETLPAFPWADAPVLTDTPALYDEVVAAYRRLHDTLTEGDPAKVRNAYGVAWRHMAEALDYASLDDYIAETDPFADLAAVDSELRQLLPLDQDLEDGDYELELVAGGRLVRIVPDPLLWDRENQLALDYGTSPVAFFRAPDGQLRIGAVLY